MRKGLIIFCATTLACSLLTGCHSNDGEVQDTQSNGSMETEKQNLPKGFGEPLTIYVAKNNIYPMSESQTVDGISQQVLSYEVTTSFGDRKLENLADWIRDREVTVGDVNQDDIWNPDVFHRADGQGNLTGSGCYVFCTIQFTNTTDEEIEFSRNNGSIHFLKEGGIIDGIDANELMFFQEGGTYDVIYMDEHWLGGMPSEIYHYVLGPGESITSEIGWQVQKSAVESYEHMYYVMKMNDCATDAGAGTDPDAVVIQLK